MNNINKKQYNIEYERCLNNEKYFIENYCRIKAPNGKLYTINYNSYKINLNNILSNKNEKRRHRNH